MLFFLYHVPWVISPILLTDWARFRLRQNLSSEEKKHAEHKFSLIIQILIVFPTVTTSHLFVL